METILSWSTSVPASEMSIADEARCHLEIESPAIEAWTARHGWAVTIDLENLIVIAVVQHPALPNVSVRFRAELPNYRIHPPLWKCIDEDGETAGSAFPAPGVIANGTSSIFHPIGFICAPWNAGAYAEHGGLHTDWGSMNNWLSVLPPISQAHTIPDMLAVLDLHLKASPGMRP
jgi:hypothetical protein